MSQHKALCGLKRTHTPPQHTPKHTPFQATCLGLPAMQMCLSPHGDGDPSGGPHTSLLSAF